MILNRKKYLSILLSLSFIMGMACKTSSNLPASTRTLDIKPVASPINLNNSEYKFYQNIKYGDFTENVFDIFLPSSQQTAALVIYIHGGGFTGGDKAKPYKKSEQLINTLLSKNIGFASINYRLLREDDGQGVFKCLNDSKRALQFIRHHAKTFNIDKESIVLMGGSAGAGTSLWIGLNEEMAEKDSADPVLRESTRVKAIVAILTQASYDILDWHNDIFKEYQSEGFNREVMIKMGGEEKLLKWYGFDKSTDVNSPAAIKVRDKLNMLKLMSNDDPEMYVENMGLPYVFPSSAGILHHHALHAKALMDRAISTGVEGSFHIPKMNIDTRNGESMEEFIIRKFKK